MERKRFFLLLLTKKLLRTQDYLESFFFKNRQVAQRYSTIIPLESINPLHLWSLHWQFDIPPLLLANKDCRRFCKSFALHAPYAGTDVWWTREPRCDRRLASLHLITEDKVVNERNICGSIPATNMALAPGSATTWFVMKTATLNSSANFMSLLSIWPSFCCLQHKHYTGSWQRRSKNLSANSPRPENSTLNSAVMESMI